MGEFPQQIRVDLADVQAVNIQQLLQRLMVQPVQNNETSVRFYVPSFHQRTCISSAPSCNWRDAPFHRWRSVWLI
jgi:hypothetical protein